MKKSTVNLAVLAALPALARAELHARREQGSISVETVVIALGLFALATAIVGFLLTWAMGKLGGLG